MLAEESGVIHNAMLREELSAFTESRDSPRLTVQEPLTAFILGQEKRAPEGAGKQAARPRSHCRRRQQGLGVMAVGGGNQALRSWQEEATRPLGESLTAFFLGQEKRDPKEAGKQSTRPRGHCRRRQQGLEVMAEGGTQGLEVGPSHLLHKQLPPVPLELRPPPFPPESHSRPHTRPRQPGRPPPGLASPSGFWPMCPCPICPWTMPGPSD